MDPHIDIVTAARDRLEKLLDEGSLNSRLKLELDLLLDELKQYTPPAAKGDDCKALVLIQGNGVWCDVKRVGNAIRIDVPYDPNDISAAFEELRDISEENARHIRAMRDIQRKYVERAPKAKMVVLGPEVG